MKTSQSEDPFLRGRIRDLWRGASEQGYLTHSRFLSLSEQAAALEVLREEGAPVAGKGQKPADGAFCLLRGGHADADRKILLCCPSWMEEPDVTGEIAAGVPAEDLTQNSPQDPAGNSTGDFEEDAAQDPAGNSAGDFEEDIAQDPAEDLITCLRVTARNARFTDHPGHRDYLGALMHLGFSREEIGDILTGEDGAWIFVLREMEEVICRELTSVRHTAVSVSPLRPGESVPVQKTVVRSGSIASERIDCIIAFVFHLSRSRAQELVASEAVFCDGRLPSGASYAPSAGERISVRGYGKFIYRGTTGKTRKGRCTAEAEVFL